MQSSHQEGIMGGHLLKRYEKRGSPGYGIKNYDFCAFPVIQTLS